MIKTKSVYDPVQESDGYRILIMRKWPKGIDYEKHSVYKWFKELAPSKELLDKWNTKKIKWENNVKQYKREQANSAAAKLAADAIGVMSTERIITLLCKERENDPHCHRHILKEIIDKKYKFPD